MSQFDLPSPRRRFRFSLAKLLAAITVVAILAAAWRVFFVKHPTYYLAYYEKAPGVRNNSIVVGPNRIEIDYLARNDRDANVQHEDGFGASVTTTSPHAQRLRDVGPWLDMVEIALAPGAKFVDVIEFRPFNHETRELLFADDGYGWKVKSPNVIQLYGIKQPLPGVLDLWFRVQSYPSQAKVYRLPAVVGSECKFPRGTVMLDDLRAGRWSSTDCQLQQPTEVDAPTVTAVISWSLLPDGADYQITAVSSDGRRTHTDSIHYFSFRSGLRSKEVVNFNVPFAEIDHFEIQPFGGRHTFFFDGMTLPKISSTSFAPTPVVALEVDGQEVERGIPDFDPIRVMVATHHGDWSTGVNAGGGQAWLTPRAGGPLRPDESFTLSYQVFGHSALPSFRFFDVTTNRPLAAPELKIRGSSHADIPSAAAGDFKYDIPLDRIKSIEVQLAP